MTATRYDVFDAVPGTESVVFLAGHRSRGVLADRIQCRLDFPTQISTREGVR